MRHLSRLWREERLTLIVVGVLLVAYLALRSSPTEVASVDEFISGLAQGDPTVVYFYSNT